MKDMTYYKIARNFIIHFLIVFVAAGRITYWQGWTFNILNFAYLSAVAIVLSKNMDLMKERAFTSPKVQQWDRLSILFFKFLLITTVLMASLDGGRFLWTHQFTISTYIMACVVFIVSSCSLLWAMRINRFFSNYIRIQDDRGHVVIKDGPYQFVRHPGVVAIILQSFSVCIILGSLYALIPATVSTILLVVRTRIEDDTLLKGLEGYADYSRKVKYRLIPGIW